VTVTCLSFTSGKIHPQACHLPSLLFDLMETNQETIHSPTNKLSILSLVFGILTIIFSCMGLIPLPLTSIICFPISVFFGILALVCGAIALNQIRKYNHAGSPMAWSGIVIGGFIFVCVLCMVIAIISLIMFAPDSLHLPPFLNNYHI